MYPYFRWIFTSYFVTASVGLMLAALTLVISQWDSSTASCRSSRALQLVDHLQLLDQPGVREDHPRVRPRAHRQAFRRRGPRDGDALSGVDAGPLLRRHDSWLLPNKCIGSGSPRRHLRRAVPGQHRHLRLVLQRAWPAQQLVDGDHVHLLDQHGLFNANPCSVTTATT